MEFYRKVKQIDCKTEILFFREVLIEGELIKEHFELPFRKDRLVFFLH